MGWATHRLVLRWLGVAAGVLAAISYDARADDAAWRKVASLTTGGGLATEVLPVGRTHGAFDRIRIESTGSGLEIQEIRAYFAEGDMQRVSRAVVVRAGGSSDAFELEGTARHIDRIEITCKAQAVAGRRAAEVTLWAETASHHTDDGGLTQIFDDDWQLLGKETVGPAVARNILEIGNIEGRFDAVRLRVLRTDVAFHDIRVVYADGEADTLAVRKLLRAGDASPPLPLTGDSRHIREIELVHEANPDMKGKAVVQIWAHRPSR